MALGETDNEKLPIIISARPQGKGKYELSEVESNYITSIYEKDNFRNFIESVIKEDRMGYCNKLKSQELFSVLGLQLRQGFNNLDFDKIIHLSRNIVKEEIASKTAQEGIVVAPVPSGIEFPAAPQKAEMGGDSRVYLLLPYVSKEKFPELLQELKQNGAKFDKEHKNSMQTRNLWIPAYSIRISGHT